MKPEIQTATAISGIIKKDKPKKEDVEKCMKNKMKNGIWISENSREKILKILNNKQEKYLISKEGYLKKIENKKEVKNDKNELDKIYNKLINKNKLYIFDISSQYYMMDEMTGEIVEYPYEDLNPYASFEYLEDDEKEIFFITENKDKKINNEEIILEIIKAIKNK